VLFTLGLGIALWFVLPIVDNLAHVGGLVAGLALAAAYPDPLDRDPEPSNIGVGIVGALLVASLGSAWMQGGRVLATYDLDTARALSVRISRTSGPYTSALMLEMLDRYDAAGALAEGEERFARAVAKFDGPYSLGLLATELMIEADHDQVDRDEPVAATLERWLAVAPTDPQALNGLAWNLVSRRDLAKRDPVRAERLSRESLWRIEEPESTGGRSSRSAYLDTLSEALHQQGRDAEALAGQQEAVDLARELKLPEIAAIEARLSVIQSAIAAAAPR